MQTELIDIIPVSNTLGEGITWDPRTAHLWWTDIHEYKIYRLHFESRALHVFDLPEKLGSFGLTVDPTLLIGAFASGFYLFDPQLGHRDLIALTCKDTPGIRMNDGRLDRRGRFWAGSMVEDSTLANGHSGQLYSVERGLVCTHFGGIQISNGLSWNRMGDRMYFTDSPTQLIRSFDFDPDSGDIGDEASFATVTGDVAPDGAVVDAEDHYWSAIWGGSEVLRFTPNGSISQRIAVDTPHVSCAEFAGPDLRYLCVTTAKWEMTTEGLAQHPNAGHMFIFKTDICGIAQSRFYPLD